MTNYEYKTKTFFIDHQKNILNGYSISGVWIDRNLASVINQESTEGWRLFSINHTNYDKNLMIIAIFERELVK